MKRPVRIPYPWPSAIAAMVIVGWQFLLLHPRLVDGIGRFPSQATEQADTLRAVLADCAGGELERHDARARTIQ